MNYGNKKYGQKKGFAKGGQKKFTPGIKEGFNNFLLSLVGLPIRTLNAEPPIALDAAIETLQKKEKLTLRGVILAFLGITDPDHIEQCITTLFNPDDEKEKKNLSYKLSNFEKLLDYQTPEYKKAGLEAVAAIKEIFGIND